MLAGKAEAADLHDNDMLCPAAYAAEVLNRVRAGSSFLELKRFTFCLGEADTNVFFSTGNAAPGLQRYQALMSIPAETRIERLRSMDWGNPLQPATAD